MKSNNRSIFYAGIIGTVLDHYDLALYTFMVPFIAPLFFQQQDPVVQLILAYGLTAVGMLTRPVGAVIFGKLALKISAKTILSVTLAGVACSTCLIGFIPTYEQVGAWSVVMLLLIRITQGLFAAGENSIANILLLEKTEEKDRAKVSSYYVASSMIGATFASGAGTLVSMSSDPSFYWRYAFISGIVTGIIGIIFRYMVLEERQPKPHKIVPVRKIVNLHKAALLKVIFVTSFSYMTYSIPFVFFNKFIPLFNDISLSEMLQYNTTLLVIDILLLPVFGIIVQRYNYIKWMMITAIVLGVTAIPAFYILKTASVLGVTAVKLWIIVTGIAFVTPSKAWMYNLIGTNERYLITGLGYAIGTEVLGRQTTTICWILWYQTNSVIAPAYYIVFLSIAAVIALGKFPVKNGN